MDRAPLPLEQLPLEVWEELRRRQDCLPLRRLRHRSDWNAISLNEQRAALRLAAKHHLDEDQSYSLLNHHHEEVQRRAANAAPALVATPSFKSTGFAVEPIAVITRRSATRYSRVVPTGWMTWFGNRRIGAKAAWLRWTHRQ
jgi:hypothetical protein